MQDTSGVHVWLVLAKAFHALTARAAASLDLSHAALGDSDFRVLEILLHKGPLPAGEQGACEADEHRRPAIACGGIHGERR